MEEEKAAKNIHTKPSSPLPTGIPINWGLITGPVPEPVIFPASSLSTSLPPPQSSAVHSLQTKVKSLTQRRARGRDKDRERWDAELQRSGPAAQVPSEVLVRQKPRGKSQLSLPAHSWRSGAGKDFSSSDEEEEVEVQVRLQIHSPPAEAQVEQRSEETEDERSEKSESSFQTGHPYRLCGGTSVESLLSDNSSSSKDDQSPSLPLAAVSTPSISPPPPPVLSSSPSTSSSLPPPLPVLSSFAASSSVSTTSSSSSLPPSLPVLSSYPSTNSASTAYSSHLPPPLPMLSTPPVTTSAFTTSSSSTSTSSSSTRHWAPPKGFWRVARPETLLLNGVSPQNIPSTLPLRDYTQTEVMPEPQKKSTLSETTSNRNDVVDDSDASLEFKHSDSVECYLDRCEQKEADMADPSKGVCSSDSWESMSSQSGVLCTDEKVKVKERAYTRLRERQQTWRHEGQQHGGESVSYYEDTTYRVDYKGKSFEGNVSDIKYRNFRINKKQA